MVCSACRLLFTTTFHKQVKMPSAGYVWIYLRWDSMAVCQSLSVPSLSAHWPLTLGTTFIICLFFSICLCHWKLYQPIVMPHVSWAAWGNRGSCCDWEHFAIRTMCLAPGNGPYVCFTPFSHHFSCIQFPQCTTVPAAALLCASQGRWLTCIFQTKRSGVVSWEK